MRFALDRPRTPARAVLCGALAALAALVAAPSARAECPNEAIRAAQGGEVLALPACMAIEQVSPAQKFNAYARGPQVSADGERVMFRSNAALGGAANLVDPLGDHYVASRGAGGWETAPTRPPAAFAKGWWSFGGARSFSPDLGSWLHIASTAEQFPLGIGRAYRNGLASPFVALSPQLAPVAGVEVVGGQSVQSYVGGSRLEAVSADHSHFYLQPGRPLGTATNYLPGDPVPGGSGSHSNAYLAKLDAEGKPELALVARDAQNRAWGGRCGASVGDVGGGSTSESDRNQGAVSRDGRRAFISTRPGQPEGTPCNPTANKMRILVRRETDAGGVSIVPLFPTPQCNRVAPACKGEAEANGDDRFQGASVDQSKLYFTTNRQLASSDLDGANSECTSAAPAVSGCDLYLYDSTQPPGQELIQVSAGETGGGHEAGRDAKVYDGVVAISGDGSHVYFAAEGVLTTAKGPKGEGADELPATTPKLYLYERSEEHPNGRIAFVGALDPGDRSNGTSIGLWGANGSWRYQAYPVPAVGENAEGEQVGGDGHILVFQSKAELTASDADEARLDVFRYHANSEELECLSCRPGGPDAAGIDVVFRRIFPPAPAGTDFAEQERWASEDGESVVFKTAQGLIGSDENGILDSYLWREGELHVLPGTSAPSDTTGQLRDIPVLSHDGQTVAFTSREQLLPSDGDTATDTYILRAGGGFPEPPPPDPCDPLATGSCKPAPGPPPAAGSPGSESFTGPGNPTFAPDCGREARRAQRLSARAKGLRRRARRTENPRKTRRLARAAKRSAKQARRLSRTAKRCRAQARSRG